MSSRKKQHIPSAVAQIRQKTGNLSSALLSCVSPCTGKRETERQTRGRTQPFKLSNLPSLNVTLERAYPSQNLLGMFLALSLKQKPQKLPGGLVLTIYSPAKIFGTNLMFEHDSRGAQFPGRDPARTCGHHALWLACPPGVLHLCCVTVVTVLISLDAAGIAYLKGAPLHMLPGCLCKPDPALYNLLLAVVSWFEVGQDN